MHQTKHQICYPEVLGTIQYHPSSLALVTGINTDIVLVQMSYMTDRMLIKKFNKTPAGPLAFSGEPPLD